MAVCLCVTTHVPKPFKLVMHHIIPEAWDGPTVPENLVSLCSTTHENVHQLLNEYQRRGAKPPYDFMQHFNLYTRTLAEKAWAAKPPDAPPVYTCERIRDTDMPT